MSEADHSAYEFTTFSEGWCAIQGSNLQKSTDSLGNSDSPSQIASQELGVALYGLDSIVESWLKLPPALKVAILAIVEISATSQKQFPTGVLPVVSNSLNLAELKGHNHYCPV